tara:strand:- start:263 stop:1483 length:1221 start_codon:yes stop_codon:yes gene_type:complete
MKFLFIILIVSFIFPQLEAKLIVDDFEKPVYVTNYPNNNQKLLVIEQEGIIKLVQNNKIIKTPFLDISDRVHQPLYPADEMGMLGMTFDPNFNKNKFFYINYVDRDSYTTISRFTVNQNLGDPDSEEILIKLKQPYPNHNGGHLEFGPDGYLYIGLGDGGSSGDPENRAQNLSNLFGSILRIDVNTEKGYKIPIDNPFYNAETTRMERDKLNNLKLLIIDIKKEIWSYGLRNPWRFSFDKETGDMYIGDVGQWDWEEINFESYDSKGGLNFGWNILEGKHCYKEHKLCESKDMILPIFEYPHDANYAKTLIGWAQPDRYGCSVTGGYVYRGKNKPELYGRYFFGDYCTGKVWSLKKEHPDLDIKEHTDELLKGINKKQFYLSSFGEDSEGELYLIDYFGGLYSITK